MVLILKPMIGTKETNTTYWRALRTNKAKMHGVVTRIAKMHGKQQSP